MVFVFVSSAYIQFLQVLSFVFFCERLIAFSLIVGNVRDTNNCALKTIAKI